MNFFAIFIRYFQLIPIIVSGIEQIHADAPGATKKQLAMESLGLASAVAGAVTPENQAAITAATNLASVTIDNVVSAANTIGAFKKK